MQTTLDKFGRVTLPKAMRVHLGIDTDTLLEMEEQGDAVIIRVVHKQRYTAIENGLLVYTGKAMGNLDQTLDDIRDERLKDV
ncbi:MAG: AbrB/MazE/SpoVT family DNA-binding domain-containing protein [Gammaproteobacteria bacterium]